MSKLKSEIAYVYSTLLVVGIGFIKVLIKAYPHEVTIGAIVTLALGFFGKRLIQKRREFRGD